MESEKKSGGALVGLVIIIIILVIGGIYVWQTNKNAIIENPQSVGVTEQDASALDTLEQDLNTTDVNIDVDVDSLE